MGRYDIFAQMLADGKISVDEYARLVNLTANAEERVNKTFLTEASEEIGVVTEELNKAKVVEQQPSDKSIKSKK